MKHREIIESTTQEIFNALAVEGVDPEEWAQIEAIVAKGITSALTAAEARCAALEADKALTGEAWFADRDLFLRYVADRVNPARENEGLPTVAEAAANHLFHVIDSRRYRAARQPGAQGPVST